MVGLLQGMCESGCRRSSWWMQCSNPTHRHLKTRVDRKMGLTPDAAAPQLRHYPTNCQRLTPRWTGLNPKTKERPTPEETTQPNWHCHECAAEADGRGGSQPAPVGCFVCSSICVALNSRTSLDASDLSLTPLLRSLSSVCLGLRQAHTKCMHIGFDSPVSCPCPLCVSHRTV